jgi:glycosyltransferase involved in cell wall biosynthesis
MNEPVVSVVIPSYNSSGTIPGTLDSLRNQATDLPYEVIIVDSSADSAAELVRNGYPEFTLLHYPTRKYCGEARNIAIGAARGDIVAFIDADCIAAPDWIDAVVTAHREGHKAVGGVIGNGNPNSYVGWAAYLLEYVQWMPGTSAGFTDDVAGANMSYDRELFERFGRFLEGCYGSDTEFHWRMASTGVSIRFDPRVKIRHQNIIHFRRFLCHEFEHGLGFARIRTRFERFSPARRLAYASLMPLIATKIFLNIGLLTMLRRRNFFRFLSVAPLLFLGAIAWGLGEARGYLAGGFSEVLEDPATCREN